MSVPFKPPGEHKHAWGVRNRNHLQLAPAFDSPKIYRLPTAKRWQGSATGPSFLVFQSQRD
jgi:hypothetical protein